MLQYKCVILHRRFEHLWPWVYSSMSRWDEEKQGGGGPGKGDAERRRQRERTGRLQVAGGSRCRITRSNGRDGSVSVLRWVKSWFSTLRTCCRGEPLIRSAFRILLLASGRAPLKEETKCLWNEVPFCFFFFVNKGRLCVKGQVCTLWHKNCAYCYVRLCVFVCDHSSFSSSSLTFILNR